MNSFSGVALGGRQWAMHPHWPYRLKRTFSILKLLKNYLRSTMNEKRLNGLAMTKINRSEEISEIGVIQIFSSASHRRLLSLDWSK